MGREWAAGFAESIGQQRSLARNDGTRRGKNLDQTLGFANDLVAARLGQGLAASPANRVGQVTKVASARREVMSSFM